VSGAYGFRIGTATPVEEPAIAPMVVDDTLTTANAAVGPTLWRAPVIPAVLRGLALAALLALAGLLALGEWVLPNAGGGVARATPWLAGTALVLLSLHAGAWIANVSATPGMSASSGIDVLRSSGSGQRELVRLACALLALWALALARRRGVAACFALAAVGVSGIVGHPSAIHPLFAIPAKILHLVAGAVWLGGLLWIVLADRTHPRYIDGARRISALALGAVLVVATTGVAQMLLFLPTPAAALHSAYGALSFAKIAGLLVLVGFGAYHRYALLPRLTPAEPGGGVALGRSVRSEIAVMTLVILIGGLLAYVPP
jgi:copper transport protein